MNLSVEPQGGRLLLRFDYNEQLKDELKRTIPSPALKWVPDSRAWSIEDAPDTRAAAATIFARYGMSDPGLAPSTEVEHAPDEALSNGLIASWYRIQGRIASLMAHWMGVPEGADAWRARFSVARDVQRAVPGALVTLVGKRLVANQPLPGHVIQEFGLREAGADTSDTAAERVLLAAVKRDAGDDKFDNHFGRLVSRRPLVSHGDYELYEQHQVSIRTIDGWRFLQLTNSTLRSSSRSLSHLDAADIVVPEGQRLRHLYDGAVCTFHGYAEGTAASTPMEELEDCTLVEWFRQQAETSRPHARALKLLEQAPRARLVRVAYGPRQRSERAFRLSSDCLLAQVLDNDSLPHAVAKAFRSHSHIPIQERMDRTARMRSSLNAIRISGIVSKQPQFIDRDGFETATFAGANLRFGGGVSSGWSARDITRSFKRAGAHTPIGRAVRIGVVPSVVPTASSARQLERFAQGVCDWAGLGADRVSWGLLSPCSEDDLRSAAGLSRKYEQQSGEYDCLLIELAEHSEPAWQNWKRAAHRLDKRTQMFLSRTSTDQWAQLNVALGILGKLGGVPFALGDSRTNIQAWLGLDVGRRQGRNIGTSCVAFDAAGRHVGWASPEPLSGERFTNEALERIISNIVDDVNAVRARDGKEPLVSLAILRDGIFFESVELVSTLESRLDLQIHLFEVRKSGAPRIARLRGGEVEAAEAGTAAWRGDWGFLQPNRPRDGGGSPTVLQVHRVSSALEMSAVMEDLFWLSKCHVGSTMQPGLPIPVHFADRLAKYAGLGVVRSPGFSTDLDFL